jgi:hypothetical protein
MIKEPPTFVISGFPSYANDQSCLLCPVQPLILGLDLMLFPLSLHTLASGDRSVPDMSSAGSSSFLSVKRSLSVFPSENRVQSRFFASGSFTSPRLNNEETSSLYLLFASRFSIILPRDGCASGGEERPIYKVDYQSITISLAFRYHISFPESHGLARRRVVLLDSCLRTLLEKSWVLTFDFSPDEDS